MLDVRLDKQRMVIKRAQLVDARRVWPNFRLRVRNVLPVLPATRIRTVSRRNKRKRVLHTIPRHLSQRVSQKRMPVAIAPVDRQLWPIAIKLALQRRDKVSVLLVDRTDAAKHLVVMRHAEHALARHVASAQDVFEEWHHVVHSFWPAKRDH